MINMNNNHSLFGESFDQLTSEINRLGYDGVLYSFFPRPMYLNSKIQPVLQYSDGYAPFVSHYLENNYGNRDFILRLALEGRNTPINWWEEIAKRKVLKHLLSNQPMKTIPETEGISQKYAEKVILMMRKEFGDISTNELLYILGMVHIHQYL